MGHEGIYIRMMKLCAILTLMLVGTAAFAGGELCPVFFQSFSTSNEAELSQQIITAYDRLLAFIESHQNAQEIFSNLKENPTGLKNSSDVVLTNIDQVFVVIRNKLALLDPTLREQTESQLRKMARNKVTIRAEAVAQLETVRKIKSGDPFKTVFEMIDDHPERGFNPSVRIVGERTSTFEALVDFETGNFIKYPRNMNETVSDTSADAKVGIVTDADSNWVQAYDMATGKLLAQNKIKGYGGGFNIYAAISADGKRFAYNSGKDKIMIVDPTVKSKPTVLSAPLVIEGEGRNSLKRLPIAFNQAGDHLVCQLYRDSNESEGFQVIDIKTGDVVFQKLPSKGDKSFGGPQRVAQDGDTLYYLVDGDRLQVKRLMYIHQYKNSYKAGFVGEQFKDEAYVSARSGIIAIPREKQIEISKMTAAGKIEPISKINFEFDNIMRLETALDGEGKTLAAIFRKYGADNPDMIAVIYDTVTGKELKRFSVGLRDDLGYKCSPYLSKDGKFLTIQGKKSWIKFDIDLWSQTELH